MLSGQQEVLRESKGERRGGRKESVETHLAFPSLACVSFFPALQGIATKYLYRDVSLHSLERYRAYLKLLREDARLPPNERRGFGRFLVSLDLKTDAYLKDPSPIDIFHTPGHEPASDLTFARSDESPLLQASETVADLLLHTPNISVLLVEDEQNTRPEFFKTIELRASDIHLACWYRESLVVLSLLSTRRA